jgi:uncharacterized membrane-anchored protein YitT (DUF2179 family)
MESKKKTPNNLQGKHQLLNDILVIFCGVVFYTFGWTAFILSQDITSGGLAGITTVIQLATSIPASEPYMYINAALMVMAFVFVSRKFAIRTLIGVGMLFLTIPVGQALFTPMDQHGMEVYNNLPDFLTNTLPHIGPLLAQDEPFVALVLGAILCGIGLGLVFSANGSTGGTDVIVAIINKYRNVSMGRAMIMVDACIVVTGAVVSHYMGPKFTWTEALGKLAFSVVEFVIVGQMLDFIINRSKQSVQFMIFSSKNKEIAEAATRELGRGCTILHSEGGYTRTPGTVLLIVTKKNMTLPLYRLIKEIDASAFVSETPVRGVYGEGFDSLIAK